MTLYYKAQPFDTKLMAMVTYLEARDQHWNGICAVGDVIFNRLLNSKERDVIDILLKPKQFSCLNKITSHRSKWLIIAHAHLEVALFELRVDSLAPADKDAYYQCICRARNLLHNSDYPASDLTHGANRFGSLSAYYSGIPFAVTKWSSSDPDSTESVFAYDTLYIRINGQVFWRE